MKGKWKALVFVVGLVVIGELGAIALLKGMDGMVLVSCINAIGLGLAYFVGRRNGVQP